MACSFVVLLFLCLLACCSDCWPQVIIRGTLKSQNPNRHKRRKKDDRKGISFSLRLLQNFILWEISQLSGRGSFSPSCQSPPSCTALHSPSEAFPRGDLKGHSTSRWRSWIWLFWTIWQMEAGPSVQWLCTYVVGNKLSEIWGNPFCFKSASSKEQTSPALFEEGTVWEALRPSYNAVTEKPVFNWSLTESAQSR